jgi:hypothetical protein
MKKIACHALAAAFAVSAAAPVAPAAAAEKKPYVFKIVNEKYGVPVFPGDITDRPYVVVGKVKAGVRKATIFSKESSEGKIYRELWERAEKMGADAVINAQYGEAHVSLTSWGKTNATGTAIRFTGDAKPATPAQ